MYCVPAAKLGFTDSDQLEIRQARWWKIKKNASGGTSLESYSGVRDRILTSTLARVAPDNQLLSTIRSESKR
ncbi:hypothetical protein R1flu_019791 [Riccia fluitans]|uniref:Uncharacterized protein n=1 Tax=Riccia fluitans TaxID=41844 RepID=A0ABD1ZJW6_9MARC